MPGPDPMPAWLTVAIGLAGSLIGWGIVLAAVGPDPAWTGIAGFLASIALVVAYRHFIQHRPLFGRDAYRFPERGFGVPEYRERLQRAGIDPDQIGSPLAPLPAEPAAAPRAANNAPGSHLHAGDPTENPAHYLGLLEELHDSGVLTDEEFQTVRVRLLERLRA